MAFLMSIGALLLAMSVVTLFFYGVVNGCLYFMKKNTSMDPSNRKVKIRQSSSIKCLTSFVLFVLIAFGIHQTMTYYLKSGVYFWFVIFTFGLLLIMYYAPLGAILMPFVKKEYKTWHRVSKFFWYYVGGTSLFWGILLIMDTSTKIYSDESGSNFYYGNLPLKVMGGISLIIVALYMAVTLASMKYTVDTRDNIQ
ncbi:hypothetical protein [Erysipelothrix anatis]|uniref:hypothetical protein n=1 Tax=Erysipelothrix anatis TaxID=2683713 RepID=UPI00135BC11C|nr:hypothetical protein [Erysipelothrix anatis]